MMNRTADWLLGREADTSIFGQSLRSRGAVSEDHVTPRWFSLFTVNLLSILKSNSSHVFLHAVHAKFRVTVQEDGVRSFATVIGHAESLA